MLDMELVIDGRQLHRRWQVFYGSLYEQWSNRNLEAEPVAPTGHRLLQIPHKCTKLLRIGFMMLPSLKSDYSDYLMY